MRLIIVLIMLLVGLSACAPRRVAVNIPAGEVIVDPVPSTPQPRHCPPGHAKKGWC